MDLKVYNTLTKKVELFKPINKNLVEIYTCGPTVYNYAHIGNLRSYIFADTLNRVLKFNDYKVKHIMNITDVGHLTSDQDEGEDKILMGAKREKKTPAQIAEFYTKAFHEDIKKLNIQFIDIECKATAHIKEMIELIQRLEKNGYTYQAGGNIYFDTSKFKNYGKLTNIKLEDRKERVKKDPNKKHSNDFVLWFTKSKFEDQAQKWNSPWKVGYPGWHIECSAMSMKYLGEQFDIHTGGIDHIPVHHTNEIAQSEAATGKHPWVKYWMHNEFLVLNEGKMSKSKGEFFTLSKIEERGYKPLDYRYFCLNSSYRKQLMFSYEAMDSAKESRKKLNEKILELKQDKSPTKEENNSYLEEFKKEINNDLNTPKALAIMWGVINDKKLNAKNKLNLLYKFDEVFGLELKSLKKEIIPKEIKNLAEKRLQARNKKDWQASDKIRDEILTRGYEIKDTKEGYEINKK